MTGLFVHVPMVARLISLALLAGAWWLWRVTERPTARASRSRCRCGCDAFNDRGDR